MEEDICPLPEHQASANFQEPASLVRKLAQEKLEREKLSTSSRQAHNRFPEPLKSFFGNPHFWHRDYYVEIVGRSTPETTHPHDKTQRIMKNSLRHPARLPPLGLRSKKGNPRNNVQRPKGNRLFVFWNFPLLTVPSPFRNVRRGE